MLRIENAAHILVLQVIWIGFGALNLRWILRIFFARGPSEKLHLNI